MFTPAFLPYVTHSHFSTISNSGVTTMFELSQEALDEIGLSRSETEDIFDLMCIQEGKAVKFLFCFYL